MKSFLTENDRETPFSFRLSRVEVSREVSRGGSRVLIRGGGGGGYSYNIFRFWPTNFFCNKVDFKRN